MNVNQARSLAQRWVEEEGSQISGFMGALFAGSTNFMDGNAPMPSTSDVDIFILVDGNDRSLTKIDYHGVVVEASIFPADRLIRPAEEILSDFRYACHFAIPSVIADPTGRLTQLQQEVAKEYPRRIWVQKRCEMLRDRLVNDLLGHSEWTHSLFWPDEVWGPPARLHYALLLAAQIPAVADLRNPTIRRSLVVSSQVLAAADRADVQESLLDCMGVTAAPRAQAEAHLQVCSQAFDYAAELIQTPFFFSAMIDKESRSIAIDGARQILDMNLHREAMWWIHFVHDIVQQSLQNDAPEEEKARHADEYVQLLAQIDQGTREACERREAMLGELTPEIMNVAQLIMDRNPAIQA